MAPSFRERHIDLSIGYASVALFGVSIAVLIWFLLALVDRAEPAVSFAQRQIERVTDGRGDARATFNVLLILVWGALHSVMTRPRFKVHLQKVLRPHLEPAVYSLVASGGLIGVCLLYRPIPRGVFLLDGGRAMQVSRPVIDGWGRCLCCGLS